jgi:hypothetical protein
MKAALSNRLWLATSYQSARRFQDAARNVAETQSHLLQTYLAHNCDTLYVSQHFPHLPLSNYDDYHPCIERISNGEKNILTAEPVQMFELSSGSTTASKMIPYTRTLKHEFQRGLSTWISDLYSHHPSLITGPAYWSISPLTDGPRHTRAGIPIGFEEDSEYLGPLGFLIGSALAVPNFVKHIHDMTTFRYVTLLYLLRCTDLRLISVWNPTFLTLLLTPLSEWWDSLLSDISHGSVTPPIPIEESLLHLLPKKLKPDPERAQSLSKIGSNDYMSVWPHLELISCWADGASESYAVELQTKFPKVALQPKGLLATEAFVSFPLISKDGGALAVTSHYFEFLTDAGDIFLAHQLEKGKTYSVVVTTGGGLYRYQLNDIIEVTGFYGQVPCFKFIGKADRVSDYFGEKLNEQFVAKALDRLFANHNLSPDFFMLAPEDENGFRYVLYIESHDCEDGLARELDDALRENFHYDYCRKLGQLEAAQVVTVIRGAETYLRACQSRGQKLGDVKPTLLQNSTGWNKWFDH